jgi:hypothetical protein
LSFLAGEPPREQLKHEWESPKVNMWCALAQVTGPHFFDEDINSFIQMLENYTFPRLSSNNSLIVLQLDEETVHVAHSVRECSNMNCAGRGTDRGKPTAWHPHSSEITSLDLFLCGYVKDPVYSQGVKTQG